MGILDNLRSRVGQVAEGLRNGDTVRAVLVRHRDDILHLQRLQLLEGKASSGEDIRPYYSEDLKPSGYFRSGASAARYAAWKGELPYPYSVSRNPDAPNLYVNGRFHSELGVEFGSDAVEVVGETNYARGIIGKYGRETFGLTAGRWTEIFADYGAYDELLTEIKTILYEQ